MSVLDGIEIDGFIKIQDKKITQYEVEELHDDREYTLSEPEAKDFERNREEFGRRLKNYIRNTYRRSQLSIQRYKNIALHFLVKEFFKMLQREAFVDYARPIDFQMERIVSDHYVAEIYNNRRIKIYERKSGQTHTEIEQAFQVGRRERQIIIPEIRAAGRVRYDRRPNRRKKALEELLGEKTGALLVYTDKNWKRARYELTRTAEEDHTLIIKYDPDLFETIAYAMAQQAVYGQTDKFKRSEDQQHASH